MQAHSRQDRRSKRKGLWGGMAPLGYETKDRKIVVVEEEAERVRTIFRNYLTLGSLNGLMADLSQKKMFTKMRSLKTGRTIGGIPFTRGPLAHLLRNRFYIGEVVFKGEVLPGEQPAILDRELFDAVQARLSEQLNNGTILLTTLAKIFGTDAGNAPANGMSDRAARESNITDNDCTSRQCSRPLSLSQMSSGWRETANRVILSPDVGRLQIDLVAAHRVTPIASVT